MRFFFPFLPFLLLIGCSSYSDNEPVQDEVLATVGDQVITKEEFILNYEFGFNHHKQGENAASDYLNHMIGELLLAQEGFELRLDTSKSVSHGVASITQERLIEEVFNTFVIEEIEVTEEEIRAEINKAAVSFQLKFLPAMSEPHARYLKQEVDQNGYNAVLATYSSEMMQGALDPEDFTSPYITSDQIDSELLSIIQDLEIQAISDPIFYNNQWTLMMVNDIKRRPIAPEEYDQKRETYRKVVYNRKAMEGAERFVTDLMDPLNLRTRREAFEPLSEAFFDWLIDENPEGELNRLIRTGTESYHLQIKGILDEPIVSWDSEEWTVSEFLSEFNPGRYQLRTESLEQFKTFFADAIALTVRDYHLLALARNNRFVESKEVQKDIQRWKSKWVFQERRSLFYAGLPFTEEVVKEFYSQNTNAFSFNANGLIEYNQLSATVKREVRRDYLVHHLKNHTDSLKEKYPVTINTELLSEIIQELEGAPIIQTQLFKQNSNRMAFPVVDPNW